MRFKMLKPYDLEKKEEEEEAVKIQEREKVIEDFTDEILVEEEFNLFLDINRTTLLIEGEKVSKTISFDLDESKTREIGITDICRQIEILLDENEYCAEISPAESTIGLEIWISSQYFREQEDFECK
ncbi:MAG: hypothetical protein KAI71_05175 [Candidatus Pacebacteria bacterium]|nr:hypothetical protein [Candidatus Paceibacterota bacterium]